ncbi:MAG: putative thiamine biosynthesis protein [Chlamydiia bacterium]|nr:putative thiamine biosynthesis protein [Chlamydiia bacterium]MCH9615638.1 putative thiamine biosynthesis protein [Chlamydiia bacterium]MCH9628959.1 putative thiamine biosynthesis protein [Chlamydiia bacterium]
MVAIKALVLSLVVFQIYGAKLLLDWWPNPNHVPLFVGVEKGFLDVEILKSFDPPQAIPFLLTGGADIAIYYMPQTLMSNAIGVEMVAKLIDKPMQGFMKRKNGPEKTMAACHCRLLPRYLEAFGKPVEVKYLNELTLPFILGEVDMVYGVYDTIESEQLKEQGIETEFISVTDLGVPNYYELVFLMKEGVDHSKFREGLQKSLDFAREHPDEAFEIYAKANRNKNKKTLRWERRAWIRTLPYLAKTPEIDKQVVDNFHSYLNRGK